MQKPPVGICAVDSDGRPSLTHDKLVARISYSSKQREVCLEVDGREISLQQLSEILSAYEGFELLLEIKEQSESL